MNRRSSSRIRSSSSARRFKSRKLICLKHLALLIKSRLLKKPCGWQNKSLKKRSKSWSSFKKRSKCKRGNLPRKIVTLLIIRTDALKWKTKCVISLACQAWMQTMRHLKLFYELNSKPCERNSRRRMKARLGRFKPFELIWYVREEILWHKLKGSMCRCLPCQIGWWN